MRSAGGAAPRGAPSAACEGVLPQPDFERMINQDKAQPYEAEPLFADNQAMRIAAARGRSRTRRAPSGSGRPHPETPRPASAPTGDDGGGGAGAADRGAARSAGAIASRSCAPPATARAATACPRWRGTWSSASRPTCSTREVRGFSAGRIFRIITRGYGLMPSYERELAIERSLGGGRLPARAAAAARRSAWKLCRPTCAGRRRLSSNEPGRGEARPGRARVARARGGDRRRRSQAVSAAAASGSSPAWLPGSPARSASPSGSPST